MKDRPPERTFLQRTRLVLLRAAGAGYDRPLGGAAPRSVLLIRPDHLGDVLLLTPALSALRRALPDAQLTLLVGPWSAEVLHDNPHIDAVETCIFPGFERKAKTSGLAPYRLLVEVARELQGRFDTAVMLRFDHWWGAWLAAAAKIHRRIGYAWPETLPFLTEVVPYHPGQHETRQNAILLGALAPGLGTALGPTHYRVKPEDRKWAGERLGQIEPPVVAIHPGAGAAVKQWPVEKWAAVADGLSAAIQATPVLTGGPGERALTTRVAAAMRNPAVDLAGQTTLGRLAAVYERCKLVLGSDSGPLHLAVAIGAATVHLYGPVPSAKFGPWGDPARNVVLHTPFVCAPCDRLDWPQAALPMHQCMDAIEPQSVLETALRLLVPDA